MRNEINCYYSILIMFLLDVHTVMHPHSSDVPYNGEMWRFRDQGLNHIIIFLDDFVELKNCQCEKNNNAFGLFVKLNAHQLVSAIW